MALADLSFRTGPHAVPSRAGSAPGGELTSMVQSWIASIASLAAEHLHRLLDSFSSSAPEVQEPWSDWDDDLNKRSTPPPEEHIDLMCIWGIEFYTPSLIDDLERNLQELHQSNVSVFRSSHHPVRWLRSLRRFRYSGGWLPLGPFATQSASHTIGSQELPQAPPYVSSVHGHIAALSPSLIAVSMCFVLDESLSDLVNTSLREDRTSTWEPIEGGKGLQDPPAQKGRDFERTRLELQGGVHEWFETHLPGVFTGGKAEVPTCQLITAKVARPYRAGDEGAPDWFSYQRLLGLRKEWNIGTSRRQTGLSLTHRLTLRTRFSWPMSLTCGQSQKGERTGNDTNL